MDSVTKVCSKCKVEKNMDDFCKEGRQCKKCHNDYSRNWSKTHPERVTESRKAWRESHRDEISKISKAYHTLHKKRIAEYNRVRHYEVTYGLKIEELEEMQNSQDGKCLICEKKEKLHLDHNHENGKIRGLLCNNCNKGIGFLKDDTRILANAIRYLMKNK